MINNSTFSSVAGLLGAVNDNNVVLSTVGGSALEFIESSVPVPYNIKVATDPENVISSYREITLKPVVHPEYSAGTTGPIATGHEASIDYVRPNARELADSVINRAINQIQPFYISVVKSSKEIPTFERQIKNAVDLRIFDHFGGWRNEWAQRLLGQFSSVVRPVNGGGNALTLPKTLPETSITTSNSSFDSLISTWQDEYASTLHDVFEELNGKEMPYWTTSSAINSFDKYFFAFLVISASTNDPWEGSDLTLEEWQHVCADAQILLAGWLHNYIDNLNTTGEEGVLIADIEISNGATVAYINPIANEKFIAQGGSPELIYGMFISEKNNVALIDDLLASKEEFVKAWDDYVVVKRVNDSERWLAVVKNTVIDNFRIELNGAPTGLFEEGVDHTPLIKSFTDMIHRDVHLSNVDDIDVIIMNHFANDLFVGEETVKLLRTYDHYLKEGLSADKAQEMAVIELIFNWVMSQIAINK